MDESMPMELTYWELREEAERLLDVAQAKAKEFPHNLDIAARMVAMAQVYATLALAAATHDAAQKED